MCPRSDESPKVFVMSITSPASILSCQKLRTRLYFMDQNDCCKHRTLKREGHHVDKFVITGFTRSCQYDNFWCSQMMTNLSTWWHFFFREGYLRTLSAPIDSKVVTSRQYFSHDIDSITSKHLIGMCVSKLSIVISWSQITCYHHDKYVSSVILETCLMCLYWSS